MHLSGQQVMELFCEALSRQSPEDRASFLADACGEDATLRARIEDLLRADEEAGRFLEGAPRKVVEGPGTPIGPYKLLEQIGEGGFGIVFMAEQTSPVRRRVALKIVKPGMDSRRIVARFEAERQALALMEHPNIARVLDAGQTESGRPYFVMELVRGTPITEFCDQHRLSPAERLELFLSVCQAVQHAHAKGIIHRDLKPSNVLVTMHDGTAVAKVIDFGIAKALGEPLTEKTLFTGFAQMVGTPRYMSPEQSEKSGLDIDTRTDIYSLGVLLYELLTGSTPLDEGRLREAGFAEVGRLIREEEPAPPSTRISMLKEAATTVSACRSSDPARLGQLLRGELDWIVLKALEKDRNRRYETASAFAADVRRYLADEPVLACPPSRLYRFGKFARRNKLALTVVALIGVGAVTTIAELATSNALIRREQARTQQARDRAEQAEKVAERQSEQIRDDLERLKTANVLLERSRAYGAESRWDDAHAVLLKAVDLRPDHATAWGDLGDLHARLGLWDLAAGDFEREFKLREADYTWRWYLHALLRLEVGDKEGYRRVASRMRERFRGTSNVIYLIELARTSVLDSDADSDADRQQVVELGRHAVAYHGRGAWFSLYALGMGLYRAGEHEEAVRRLEESLRADDMPWSPRALSYPGLAMARHRLGQAAEAREALAAAARVFDHWTEEMYQAPVDKRWVIHLGAAAHWPVPWWDWLEGRRFYREAKLLIDGLPPADDPRVHVLRARSLAALRWHTQAEAEYGLALNRLPQDPQIRLEAHRNRAYGFVDGGRWHDAAAQFDLAGELKPGDDHLGMFCAVAHLAAGEIDAYRRTCERLVERFQETEDFAVACNVLLACVLRPDALLDMGRLQPLVRVASVTEGASPPETGAALYRLGEFAEAERRFEMISKVSNLRGGARCFLAMARHRLGRTSAARQTLAEATRWIDEAKRDASDDPTGTRPAWGTWHEKLACDLLLSEAREVIQTSPSDNGQIDAAIARCRRGVEADPDSLEALGELAKALKLKPNDAHANHERGSVLARLGRWRDAAAACDRGFELDPTDDRQLVAAAYLHLAAGDVDAYRRACEDLVKRFGETNHPQTAECVAKACLLTPDALNAVEAERLQKLAERAVAGQETEPLYRFCALCKGLADYRAGRHAEAVTWMQRFAPSADGWHWDATALAILAMAEQNLGEAEEAQAALAKATAIMTKMADPAKALPTGHDLGDVLVGLHARFLCREAEALLKQPEGGRSSPGLNKRSKSQDKLKTAGEA
ncbi:MAG TPA: protein kinase [Pirellulales bacterium]|jgi:hypothetical protein|nr:protein kinase [Pirellulales bacterium]